MAACLAVVPQWSCVSFLRLSVEGKNHIWSKVPLKIPEAAALGPPEAKARN